MATEEPPVFGMKVTLRIIYHTNFGDCLMVAGSPKTLGAWDPSAAQAMYYANGTWEATFALPYTKDGSFEYKYFVRYADGNTHFEAGANRVLEYSPRVIRRPAGAAEVVVKDGCRALLVEDAWRPTEDPANALYSSAFARVLFGREAGRRVARPADARPAKGQRLVRLTMRTPRVDAGHQVCVVGSCDALGAWDEKKAVVLDDQDFPLWHTAFLIDAEAVADKGIKYKYGIYDTSAKRVLTWEDGADREITAATTDGLRDGDALQRNDESFRYPVGNWKGAGVAVPVFSLRSEQGCGVGEFSDLRAFVDWARSTGMRLVQILPVNDTVATHTWTDSYPYAAISVFALHPIYLRMQEMGTLEDKAAWAAIEKERAELNRLKQVDYERVHRLKSRFYKLLFDQERDRFLANPDFQKWFAANKTWLLPYAVFSCLRDRFGTVDFNWWPAYSRFDAEAVEAEMASPGCASYDDVCVHYFIQYHLHLQLGAASEYARSHGVVLKGDLPIGIYRYSVDAWTSPHLFNMNCQTGAPPDDFAEDGQNWGFPTYNWNEMAKDDYAWWRARLGNMAEYFDAFRIDHILGFFRIWEIPYHAIDGLLGQFNPAHPMTADELRGHGVWLDYDRMCKPYIREWMLGGRFGEYAQQAAAEFLQVSGYQAFAPKAQFATQRQVDDYCTQRSQDFPEKADYYRRVRKAMFGLIAEVLFLEAGWVNGQKAYAPRISIHKTQSFQDLPGDVRGAIDRVYVHFFFHRQEGLWWDQAQKKLPAIKNATDMLVCGEDLGMVPKCVPPAMSQLQILSLNVQRMPKDPATRFFHPADAPYLSVVTPSTHDTSTLREWWEENRETSRLFFKQQLGRPDEAPLFAEPWLSRLLLEQHMHSPAMWAIIPVQDLLAIDGKLRLEKPGEERINVPAISKHYWRYRMHLSLEQLTKAADFNDNLHGLISTAGRDAAF
eukprot:m51a1_g10310 putative 4-alpha-glucanotransferase (947) ;mRNA; f:83193-87613